MTYKEKYAEIKEWLPAICEAVKKEIRNEHLRQDPVFARKYLDGKNPQKVDHEELAQAYSRAIAEEESGEQIAEFLTSRWIMKNGDLYHYFEQELSKINPDFAEIKSLEPVQEKKIMEGAVEQFGAPSTYLFSVLNAVAFSKDALKDLGDKARIEKNRKIEEKAHNEQRLSADAMIKNHEIQMARLTDKYEKKLSGMEKKYFTDVAALKKQVSLLQKKLNEK